MKQLLEEYISTLKNGYKDTHGIRWMSSRNPKLWKQIVEETSFLDDTAKPKQRCWHILNNIWEHPRCPVTNEKVKWWENRYLTYSSTKAQMSDPINQKLRQETMMKRYGVKHALQSKKLKQKCANTWMEKYGVKNPSLNPESIEKMRQTRMLTGTYRKEDEIEEVERYNMDVDYYTNISWREHQDKINPNKHERGVCKYHLDHKYPKILGYMEGIDPKIIGHWTNLQVIHYIENLAKHAKTDITKEYLLEEYNKNR